MSTLFERQVAATVAKTGASPAVVAAKLANEDPELYSAHRRQTAAHDDGVRPVSEQAQVRPPGPAEARALAIAGDITKAKSREEWRDKLVRFFHENPGAYAQYLRESRGE